MILDQKRFGGVIFCLLGANKGLPKSEAERRVKVYKEKGYLARRSKSTDSYLKGHYDVYIRSKNFEASVKKNPDKSVKYESVDLKDGYPVIKWRFTKNFMEPGKRDPTNDKWYV